MTIENQDTSGAAGGADTSAQKPNPAPATSAPASAPKDAENEVRMPSDAFKSRLSEERSKERAKFLREHGFENEEAFKAFQKSAKEAADAKLSDDERREKRIKELEAYEGEAKKYKERFLKDVSARFAALDEATQKTIEEEAGDDPELRDRFMRVLAKSSGQAAGASSGSTVESEKKAPLASTTKSPPAPRSTTAPTPWETWQRLRAENPARADAYFQLNEIAIDRSAPTE